MSDTTDNTPPSPEVPDLLPISEMDKTSLREHNRQFHNAHFDSKATIGRMTEWHEGSHANVALRRLAHDHTHSPIVLTDQEKAQIEAVRSNIPMGDKPLSVSERKVLSTLVDNDFSETANNMRQMAADMLANDLDVLKREYDEKGLAGPAFAAQIKDVMDRARDDAERLVENARLAGIDIKHPMRNMFHEGGWTVDGYEEARRTLQAENASSLKRALLTLERARLGAQRTVLLSGITPEAALLLGSVPKADQMMVAAAQERTEAGLARITDENKV